MADFSAIPSIEQLRLDEHAREFESKYGQPATVDALRQAAAVVRRSLAEGHAFSDRQAVSQRVIDLAGQLLERQFAGSLRAVINATGVIIHTNLGRAPLATAALERVIQVGRGYCNLEYDLEQGTRGSRTVHAESLLAALTGAEAAVVVNNNAAATMLILAAHAHGREVIISRGEMVEIGGGFRVPDVMRQSGALLREVGTTNRTRAADYRAAITPATAMLLRVHPSNFRIEGFTERPALPDLVKVARDTGVLLVEDLGSGNVDRGRTWEDSVQQSVGHGVDLVCFSGDKLLGGPQAGIVAGRRAAVDALKRHPLMRAFRVDKLTLAALEGTLLEYRAGRADVTIPVARLLATPLETIKARADRLAALLQRVGWRAELIDGHSTIGGGSAPGVEISTVLVALAHPRQRVDAVESWLRHGDPAVVARIESDRLVLDLRTVLPEQDEALSVRLSGIESHR